MLSLIVMYPKLEDNDIMKTWSYRNIYIYVCTYVYVYIYISLDHNEPKWLAWFCVMKDTTIGADTPLSPGKDGKQNYMESTVGPRA